jgi:hypothetical protein
LQVWQPVFTLGPQFLLRGGGASAIVAKIQRLQLLIVLELSVAHYA